MPMCPPLHRSRIRHAVLPFMLVASVGSIALGGCTHNDALGAAPTSGTDGSTDATEGSSAGTTTESSSTTAETDSGGGDCFPSVPSDPPYDVLFLEGEPDEIDEMQNPNAVHVPYLRLRTEGEWQAACPELLMLENAFTGNNGFYVYRPSDSSTMDGWPEGRLHAVLFMHAHGGHILDAQEEEIEHFYPMLERLTEQGFVVLAGMTSSTTVGPRTLILRCAAEWVLNTWEEAERINGCGIAAVGHSQGGAAVHELSFVDDLALAGLGALVGIAPGARVVGSGSASPVTFPVPAERAVPYLVLQGPNDEDTTHQGQTNYDRMVPEDTEPVPPSDKVML
jgi:hypothetical protein